MGQSEEHKKEMQRRYWREYAERARLKDGGEKNRLGTAKVRFARFGATIEDHERLWIEQNAQCAICKTDLNLKGRRGCQFDHCHKTNKARGLLCGDCNRGLGGFKDNPGFLLEAVLYLEKYR
jgi:hypothetical protein